MQLSWKFGWSSAGNSLGRKEWNSILLHILSSCGKQMVLHLKNTLYKIIRTISKQQEDMENSYYSIANRKKYRLYVGNFLT